jgi:hypothetical protein
MIAQELLELTDIIAKRLLKKMVEDGILVAVDEKNFRKYILSKRRTLVPRDVYFER